MEENRVAAGAPARPRYRMLDEIRGLAFLSMAGYHAMWDLVFLFGLRADWYYGRPGAVWQFLSCSAFILLSGYCVSLGRHTLRRGLIVFGAGALVTLVTELFMPADLVLFGVLTMLGSVMILAALAGPLLRRVPAWLGLAGSLLLFLFTYNVKAGYLGFFGLRLITLPDWLYANLFMTWLGFPHPLFYSTDYFGIIPWLFLFLVGYYLHDLKRPETLGWLRGSFCRPLGWIGRHSLILYLLHQPVLYGAMIAIYYLRFWLFAAG
ncbi:MAG: DUF1624 domain-containing protein [Candidatus Faecalibacterium intestinavium]|uniref:DUF1624 domain-containing protein n=1 Tax=Candidatus Faecalibacterium intestinavium TaxID=2838580 RepID=A0A9E2NQL4_9FIRM|nr:DUF1624 domain-containing protein [Candidatus Faecalibacterium intestinavium]